METLKLPNLSAIESVRHHIFSRHGGCSQGDYASLNFSLGVGDDIDAVQQNRRILLGHMKAARLAFSNQVHGTQVLTVDQRSFSAGKPEILHAGTGDAMITNIPGVALVVLVADCQAVLMVDPVKRVVANVHVGWRGNVNHILCRTITEMNSRFDCNPVDLRAGISPSLGPCCAEFVNFTSEMPKMYWHHKDRQNRFDLWALSREQLLEEGVLSENIHVSGICTRCRTDNYFSYRASKITGRFAAAIQIKGSNIPER
ncbi:MAG: peptidoglycan editing factor PgeF [Deltaproteobacteria bacterium]|nr:MAG: peptidoglycan editing factor PgeF [Deltaproteobacteria bacterium]RLC13535.1 MAG: peptidoglycan editing factor PgeF [Deltaproteobacteria bacterium]HHE74948.1 peptidoglycan editing factor PgeF [Desulfobacteraceae bacterium]